ncbi:hypothetical protein ORI89_00610 [Sphingobacterium sp. UT-1RO-CII-1]|uniref:chaperone modulator CbpM n=1 Tax=Sphingobacterium sp. UT-1RO-CII-1 TaxID=2995225 RepID=UPI00227B61EA|nr:chaperone modulator CbpM [Sphingobacterium sp. UT-1RO-CII-1]MCY4778133.1 hypothetical protein [Sphingobacterium sp. UT-1RO-CII-1]
MERTLIKIVDICKSHQIETQFIRNLSESGLIQIITEREEEFVDEEELRPLEQFVTWHYELDINLQGIEVAYSLIKKIEKLQEEIERLKKER